MIHTSYFSSRKYKPEDGVAITLGGAFWKGDVYKELAPTPDILNWYKKEQKNTKDNNLPDIFYKNLEQIYEVKYRHKVLDNLDVHKVAHDLDGRVLLCFEKSEDFCHRHIVAKWLEENGYKCKEL